MKFTHISAFTIAALATSVHAILPQPSETIESVDPSSSLNSQSVPQATGGPEFPSTSTTQGPGGSQGDHSNQTPGARLKSYDLSGTLRGIGKKHKSGHQKAKKHQNQRGGSIDSLLMLVVNTPGFLQMSYQGGAHGSTYLSGENSRQHQRIGKAILKGINSRVHPEVKDFREKLSKYWLALGRYEAWVRNILDCLQRFKPSELVSNFIEELAEILKNILEAIGKFKKGIYREVSSLNKDSSLLRNTIDSIEMLISQFTGGQMSVQEPLIELFERYGEVDWYETYLERELNSWLEGLGLVMFGGSPIGRSTESPNGGYAENPNDGYAENPSDEQNPSEENPSDEQNPNSGDNVDDEQDVDDAVIYGSSGDTYMQ
ncbi:hypothetical protein BATDEDRAFT_92973 [Batrachochytrium dendrobatidis JAM81]|uniref:Uncharacterized protein n=1 Tax=Batrachochytrium dendrobatidis (strain JAM81 / FGSC 10211) TaxID=684364 RepID=F4PF28_BATDJ|nr:uncharacterized protein BATDEDRAFT_92973 [Batrachochytrium dendrobatidis JAM81]EGF76169.1 hypothetical protein BATDEDRAFT_92973 [Batrachochytrium dendrobatidis JAM81]|eukprot:XP_006683211.1 hypothetical protein BATDEDRAFT_92973 [Batrachochytrium dendrobatidis JAM81]